MVEFTLAGQRFQALNGGPQCRFTEAVSFSLSCRDAGKLDRIWTGLTASGGEPGDAAGCRTGSACHGRWSRTGWARSCPTPTRRAPAGRQRQ